MSAQTSPPARYNLAYLQEESLMVVIVLSAAVGYVWLWANIWPITGLHLAVYSWIGSGLLVLGALLGYHWRATHPKWAAYLVTLNLLAATTCLIVSIKNPTLVYLFTLPIIFASVLLSRRGLFGVALLTTAIVIGLPFVAPNGAGDALLPLAILVCLTGVSWLSARSLHTTLAWFGDAYNSAYHNARIAREHEAQLRIALKSLDEMTSRLERANHTLRLERNQAEEARRLKQQFAQTISHELRTPLNIIVAFTDLMAQSPEYYGLSLPAPYMRDLSIIHRNAKHLQMLVNDVLDLARIEAAQMVVIPEATNPADLAQEAVQTVRSLVETRGLTLQVTVEPDLPTLWVDTTRIRQVLFNLLNNAARFTERGCITVTVERRAEEVLFSVRDTGAGIAPEDIPRLFVEFQQLNTGTHRQFGGAGLGLAISRRFVELHNGKIGVESQVGQGSTFYFTLPIRRHDLAASTHADEWLPLDTPTPADEVLPVVLVVTRSPSAASLLSRRLLHCRTVVVQTLGAAAQACQHLQPHCVILDTALEPYTAESLQGLARAWDIDNSLLIACLLPGEALRQKQLAVHGYLVKPVSAQTIRTVLDQFEQPIRQVLVIDDNHDFALMLTRLLSDPTHPRRVISAYNAQEALALLEVHHPDLIFLDIQLPDMNGIQLLGRIRERAAFAQIPIVVLSGEDEAEIGDARDQALLLTKPAGLTLSDTLQFVQALLTHSAK